MTEKVRRQALADARKASHLLDLAGQYELGRAVLRIACECEVQHEALAHAKREIQRHTSIWRNPDRWQAFCSRVGAVVAEMRRKHLLPPRYNE